MANLTVKSLNDSKRLASHRLASARVLGWLSAGQVWTAPGKEPSLSETLTRTPIGGADDTLARPLSLADLVEELVIDAEERLQASVENRPLGPQTRIPTLDHALGHALEPGLHSITGDPGAGKTAIAAQVAARCGYPAIYITAEQSAKVLFQRHIARETRTDRREVKSAVPQKIRELAQQAAAASPMLLILDATRRPAPRHQIIALAQAHRQRFGARQILLVVDALQPWAKGLNDGAEYDQIQAGIADLVAVHNELSSPVLVLSHRNRLAARDRNATGLTAAKGSADIEHLAETALHLSRPDKEFDPCDGAQLEISCHISKNRHGPCGFALPLYYEGRTDTFSDRW